jgi:co-chaperonin GroES (HSP10)
MSGATPTAAATAPPPPPPSATVTSAEASMQPLNLSKRIESKNSNATSSAAGTASSMASSAQNNAEKQTAASNGHDIPTEAWNGNRWKKKDDYYMILIWSKLLTLELYFEKGRMKNYEDVC